MCIIPSLKSYTYIVCNEVYQPLLRVLDKYSAPLNKLHNNAKLQEAVALKLKWNGTIITVSFLLSTVLPCHHDSREKGRYSRKEHGAVAVNQRWLKPIQKKGRADKNTLPIQLSKDTFLRVAS